MTAMSSGEAVAKDAGAPVITDVSATDPSRKRSFDIPSLDGLRAFSITLVFFSHILLSRIVPGGFGVTVFFFLSGYLITTLLRREAETHGKISLKKFYLRRTLRIFPPMYFALVVGLILTAVNLVPRTATRMGILSHAFYFTNYFMIFCRAPAQELGCIPGLGSLWSLAVEEHFYLIFPLMYISLRRFLPRPKHQFIALGMLWLAISAWRCLLVWMMYRQGIMDSAHVQRVSLATDTRLDSILIGCMLAIWGNPFLDKSRWSEDVWKILLAVGITGLLISFVLPGIPLRESIRYSLQNWALVPVFVCSIRHPEWILFRGLNIGWIKFIGVLSYSLYLVHYMMLEVFFGLVPTNAWIEAGGALACSLGLAYLMYLTIEKPCAVLRRRLT